MYRNIKSRRLALINYYWKEFVRLVRTFDIAWIILLVGKNILLQEGTVCDGIEPSINAGHTTKK